MNQGLPSQDDASHAGWVAMRALFPLGVHSAFSDARDEPPPLFEAEARSMANAVPARQREFALGRWCARAALGKAGLAAAAIPVRDDRSPAWPAGFVGSITHCAGFVGAVVARADVLEAIGFDVEPAEPLSADLARLVCTEAEISWMHRAPPPPSADWGKVLFCAKEAVHKCIAPRSGVMLDFREVEVNVYPLDGTFSARLATRDYPTLPDLSRLQGRFAVDSAFVSTAASISVSCQASPRTSTTDDRQANSLFSGKAPPS